MLINLLSKIFKCSPPLIIVLLVLISLCPAPEGVHFQEFSPTADTTFITKLIAQSAFSECSLFILQDNFDNGQNVDKILFSLLTATYSIKISLSEAGNVTKRVSVGDTNADVEVTVNQPGSDAFVKTLQTLKTPSLSPKVPFIRFPLSLDNVRKRSSQCLLVILMINDLRPEFMKLVFKLLTPVYIPITRKDEDFYIFKTDLDKHKKLLLMPELPNRIKFKIAVGVDERSQDVAVNTICFFCEAGGNPRMIRLPVEINEANSGDDFNYFADFVSNLNGKLLHVSVPFIIAKVEVDPPWTGVANARRGNWKMLFETFLTAKFNFTYHMFLASGMDGNMGGGGTGLRLENGTWIGVTGDLVSGRADLGIVIANTPKRIYAIDFTDSFFDVGCLTFVTAQPTAIFSPAALLWPFDFWMWFGIILSTALSIGFLFTSFQLMNRWNFGDKDSWPLRVQVQFLLSTFLEQDSPVLPESQSVRCFVSLWIFFTMIVTTVYRSKLVTLLAFPILGKLPLSFEQLTFSDYTVGFMKHGDSAFNTLAASTDPVYVKLVAEMEIFQGVGLECLEKVVTSQAKYGCIAYDFAMYHLRERNLSDEDTRKLVFAPARTYNIWLGLATEGKSIYRINFGKLLSRTRPFHLADIWDRMDMYANVRQPKLEWWRVTNQWHKLRRAEEESDNLTLKHIAGAFYVLIGCLVVASLAFIHELSPS